MPNPSVYEGVQSTQRGLDNATWGVRYVKPGIHLLQKEIAPITTLLMNMRMGERVTNPKVEWEEDEMLPHVTKLNNVSGYLSTDKTFIVDEEAYGNIGAFIKVPRTGEVMGPIVAQDSGLSNFTVAKRGCFGSSAAALVDNDVLIFIRGNIGDGGDAPEAINTLPTPKFNYIEPTSTVYGATEMLEDMETYNQTGKIAYQRPKKMKEHMESREVKVLFGTRGIDTTVTPVKYSMGGLFSYLTTTVETITVPTGATKGFTMKQFMAFIKRLFTYNESSAEKVFFCDGEIINNIDEFKLQLIDLNPNDMMLNFATKSVRTSFGTLHLVHHRMLNENFGYPWYGIALDLKNVELQPFQRQYVRRIPPGRGHSEEYEIYQSDTLVVKNEPTCGIFRVVNA